MSEHGEVDVNAIIRGARLNRFHVLIVALCTTVAIFDGFDTQIIAYVGPMIVSDFHIPFSSLGTLFGAGMVGLTIGALCLPILADLFGRKPLILVATAMFAVLSILTVSVDSFAALLTLRILTGLGLGAALPNVVALVSEYAPNGMRVLVNITLGGFGCGALLAGAAASWLLPHYGWHALFYVGGAIPLVSLVLLAIWLPESPPFLVLKAAPGERIARLLEKVDPTWNFAFPRDFTVEEKKLTGFTVPHLFTHGRTAMTVLLWVAQFMNLLVLLFMLNWTPSLLREAGMSMQASIWTTVGFSVGGVIGAILVGRLMDLGNPFIVLSMTLFGTACCITLVAHAIGNPTVLAIAVGITGFGVAGAQNSLNTISGMLYPTAIRSTGVGWSMGIGRIGSIIGPTLGGLLVAAQWDVDMIINVQAVPALIASICVLCLPRARPTEDRGKTLSLAGVDS
ncbi:MAG TPA: MFS transporter [Stellaceae bacterium]|nr:MFS transporter [Stellaceae bacterium]